MNRKQTLEWLKIKRLERAYQSLTQWYESKLKKVGELANRTCFVIKR